MTNAATLINQTSGKVEYYTPADIVEAARRVMGSIDLDPASSPAANETVKATTFFTEGDDGLARPWFGCVWMNHPFGRDFNRPWVSKLVEEYQAGRVDQACCITFASTSEAWFQPLFSFPLCFLSPRTNYRLPDGSILRGVTKGSVVAYLGDLVASFATVFGRLGRIMLPVAQGLGYEVGVNPSPAYPKPVASRRQSSPNVVATSELPQMPY